MSTINITCSFCCKEFERKKKNVRKDADRYFCSKECMYKQQQIDQSDKYTLVRYDYNHAKRRAKRDNIYFDLTIDYVLELWEIQEHKCALSGEILVFGNTVYDKQHGKSNASLDRKDSFIGYTKGNVQWVHKRIQQMKFDTNEAVFKYWCRKVADWQSAEAGLTYSADSCYNRDETPF